MSGSQHSNSLVGSNLWRCSILYVITSIAPYISEAYSLRLFPLCEFPDVVRNDGRCCIVDW